MPLGQFVKFYFFGLLVFWGVLLRAVTVRVKYEKRRAGGSVLLYIPLIYASPINTKKTCKQTNRKKQKKL